MKKIYNFLIFLIIFVLFLFIFLFLTLNDLQISFIIADLPTGEYLTTNLFAIFFEIFGEFVLYVLCSFSLGVIIWTIKYKVKNFYKYLIIGIMFCSICILNFFGVFRILFYLQKYTNLLTNYNILIFLIIFSIIFAFLIIFLLKNVKKNIIYKLFWFSCLIILVAIFANFVVFILKNYVFIRLRYCVMNFIQDFSYYTPWWQINNESFKNSLEVFRLKENAFKSFPSGHVSASAITLCFCFASLFFKNKFAKITKISLYALPIFFVCLVGLSRVVAGAHFVSDVVFAILINLVFIAIFTLFLLAIKKSYKKRRNKNT